MISDYSCVISTGLHITIVYKQSTSYVPSTKTVTQYSSCFQHYLFFHVRLVVSKELGGTVTKKLDPPFFVPPGPNISKYLDPPEQKCLKYMDPL